MTTPLPRPCSLCRHLHGVAFDEAGAMRPRACDAFPAGIPETIWEGKVDHREPFVGDKGIRWEHDPELGLPGYIQTAIMEGALDLRMRPQEDSADE